MRFKTLALIGTLALAGCGSQTYTAQPVKPAAQHVTTVAQPVKPKLQIRCTNAALATGNCGTPQQQAAARVALSAPSWVLYAKQHGCPAGEIQASNGGCVSSGSHECAISEPTCNPANYPDPAQSTTAPPSQPQSTPAPQELSPAQRAQSAQQIDQAAQRACKDAAAQSDGELNGTMNPDGTCQLSNP